MVENIYRSVLGRDLQLCSWRESADKLIESSVELTKKGTLNWVTVHSAGPTPGTRRGRDRSRWHGCLRGEVTPSFGITPTGAWATWRGGLPIPEPTFTPHGQSHGMAGGTLCM